MNSLFSFHFSTRHQGDPGTGQCGLRVSSVHWSSISVSVQFRALHEPERRTPIRREDVKTRPCRNVPGRRPALRMPGSRAACMVLKPRKKQYQGRGGTRPYQFMAPMRAHGWRSKLPTNLIQPRITDITRIRPLPHPRNPRPWSGNRFVGRDTLRAGQFAAPFCEPRIYDQECTFIQTD